MAKTQKNAQKSTQKKQSQKQTKELTVRLSELTEEQFKDVLTEAVQTAEAELKAEAEQKQTEAQQTATETAEEQKQTEATETADSKAEETADSTATVERIERTVTDRQFAELKAVADSFVLDDDEKFHVALENAKKLETADGEGTDNSVFVGRYGVGSNGNGKLVSVWCRRKATERKAVMFTDWLNVMTDDSLTAEQKQKKADKLQKQKHSFPTDFGLRFSVSDFMRFYSVAESKAVIDSFSTENAEVKHREPRFSFTSLSAVTKALSDVYTAYETAQERIKAEQTAQQTEATKEATDSTAEEQKKA